MVNRPFSMALATLLAVATALRAEEVPQDQLPNFASKYFLTLIVSGSNTQLDTDVERLIATDPNLMALYPQLITTKWSLTDSPWVYQTDWRFYLQNLPAPIVILQPPPNGAGRAQTIFVAAGGNITLEPGKLADQLLEAADKYIKSLPAQPAVEAPPTPPAEQLLPRRGQPNPSAGPTPPAGKPVIEVPKPLIQTLTKPTDDETKPKSPTGFPIVLLLVPLAAGAYGVYKAAVEDQD